MVSRLFFPFWGPRISPTLVGFGPYNSPSCVHSKILNDYPLYFSEILHGVTFIRGNVTLRFLKIILVAAQGVF